jgi:hypothetical protein
MLKCEQVCDPKSGPPCELAIFGHSPTWEKEFEADGSLRRWYTYLSKSHWNEGWTDSELRVAKSILLFDVTSIPRFAYYRDGGGAHFEERKTIEALDVHVDATLALLVGPSVRLGFSPGQLADFVLGFFGLDIAGDDTAPAQAKPKATVQPAASRAQ